MKKRNLIFFTFVPFVSFVVITLLFSLVATPLLLAQTQLRILLIPLHLPAQNRFARRARFIKAPDRRRVRRLLH